MTVYNQNDPRWKNNKIGFDTGPSDTIGNYGCYMTAIANVCSWAGNELNPQQINDLAKQNGWLVASDLIARDDIPALLCNNLEFVGRTNWTDAVSMNFFADASDPNVAYIIKIDASKAPGIQSHFVMVWATLGGNDLEIEDSWDGVRKPLSHYGNPSVIIYSATKFVKKAVPTPAPTPPSVPSPAPLPPPSPVPTPVIAPPVIAPSREVYPIKVTIPKYASMTDALNKTNPTGVLNASPTNYYAFNTLNGMVSITTQPGMSQGIWINPTENVVQTPVPTKTETSADVMKSWHWGYATHEPAEYKIIRDYMVKDLLRTGHDIQIKAGHTIDIYGSFVKDGTTYLRPLTSVDDKGLYYWYGIPTSNIHTGEPYLENEFDVVDQVQEHWESFYDKIVNTIEGIFHPKKRK